MSLLLSQLGGASPQTITANGLAQPVAFGTAQLKLNVAAAGIAQSIGLGTAQLKLNIAAAGIAQAIGLGTAQFNQNIAAPGIAQAIGFGNATLANDSTPQTITATGLAQPVEFGNATLSTPTPAAPAPGGGPYWNSPRRRRTVPVVTEDEDELLALCLAHYLRD
jgi:hypothetical protein